MSDKVITLVPLSPKQMQENQMPKVRKERLKRAREEEREKEKEKKQVREQEKESKTIKERKENFNAKESEVKRALYSK